MSSTTFVDYTTPIVASWLNDINTFFYSTFSGAPNGPGALAAIGGLASTAAAATYAPLASPTFTGTPNLPTGTVAVTQSNPATNTTAVATCAFVQSVASGSGYLPQAQQSNVFAIKENTASYATTLVTSSQLVFNTSVYDDLSEYNVSTGIFTPTYTGTYRISGSIQLTAGSTGSLTFGSYIDINAADSIYSLWYNVQPVTSSLSYAFNFSGVVKLTAGDHLKLYVNYGGTAGTSTTVASSDAGGSYVTYMNITRTK